jgi:hypothetical protein
LIPSFSNSVYFERDRRSKRQYSAPWLATPLNIGGSALWHQAGGGL